MGRRVCLIITAVAMLSFLMACAQPVPTAAPTKPAAATAATTAPAPAATTSAPAATKPAATAVPTAAAPVVKIKRGGTVRGTAMNDWGGFDPHLTQFVDSPEFSVLYDTLLDYQMVNGKLAIIPRLATSWEFANGGREVIFRLQKGVRFHDGTDLDAQAVKWNFDRMLTHPKRRTQDIVEGITGAEVRDSSTFVLKLGQPSASILTRMTDTVQYGAAAILSPAAVDKWGDKYGSTAESTVGSGPFKLMEWLSGDRVKLERFDRYWDMGEDGKALPYVDVIIVRFIPDSNVRLLELRSGNIDFMDRVAPKDVRAVRADPNLVMYDLSWADYAKRMNFVPTIDPWANKTLRKAISYALDREAMANTLGLGSGRPQYYWFSSANVGYNESLPRYDYQPDKAKQLLKEAGFTDGLDVTLTQIDRIEDRQLGEVMQAMLSQVGVRAKIDILERLAHNAAREQGKLGFVTGGLVFFPDPAQFSTWVTTKGAANNFRYSNPELDKCFVEGDVTLDQTKRQTIYENCQKIMFEDANFVPLWSQKRFDATTKIVKGWQDNWTRTRYKWLWLDK